MADLLKILPDGNENFELRIYDRLARSWQPLRLEHLPPPGMRWVVRRKAIVVQAIHQGLLTIKEACARYHLSGHEIASWVKAIEQHGIPGLRATRMQIYRPDWVVKTRSRKNKESALVLA